MADAILFDASEELLVVERPREHHRHLLHVVHETAIPQSHDHITHRRKHRIIDLRSAIGDVKQNESEG